MISGSLLPYLGESPLAKMTLVPHLSFTNKQSALGLQLIPEKLESFILPSFS